jgi:hypothetical protein
MGGTCCISRRDDQVAMAIDNIYSKEVDKILGCVTYAQSLNNGEPVTGPMISAVLVESGVYKDGSHMFFKIMNLVREDFLWCDAQVHKFSTVEYEGYQTFSQMFKEHNPGYTINKKT